VKDENLIGTYYHFLAYELAEEIRIDHLVEVLTWLLDRKTSLGNEILEGSMIQGIMLRAWNQLHDPDIAAVFSKLVYKRLLGHQEYRATSLDRTYINELGGDTIKRRVLVSQVVGLMSSSKEAFYLSYNPNFLSHDDIDWIIANIEQSNKREIWSQLLFYIADIRSQDDLSKIYNVYEKYAEAHEVFSKIFEPVDLSSELAKQMRDYENQSQAIEQARSIKPVNQVNHQTQLLSYMDQFREGDIDAWWKLNLLFLSSDPNKGGHEFDFDLTSFALWESIEPQTRDSLVLMAQQYLVKHSGGEIYLNDKRIYRPAVSAFRALYLIAIKKPEVLDNLSADVWQKWASVIISYPVFDSKNDLTTHQGLVSKLIQVSTEQFYNLLRTQIITEESASQYLRVLKLIEHLDTHQLQELLVDVLESETLSPASFGQVLQYLLERNNVKAKQIALRFVVLEVQDDDILLQKRFQASRSLMLYSHDAGWPTIGDQIKSDKKFGEHLFQSLAYDRYNLAGILVSKLSENNVAELYFWLERRFPAVDDPTVGGFHEVSERESVGQFRELLISSLASKGSKRACLVLKQLISKYPEKSNLPYYLQMCEEKMRHDNWNPYLPYYILEITRTAYTKYILRLRHKQNLAFATVSLLANIFIAVLPGAFDYENNTLFSFLASHQTLSITILVISTLASMYVNLNRPITE
jgi:hypothetical protein